MSFNHSIYFLCKKPNQDLIEFSKEILDENFCNVFIVVDDNSFYFEDKMFLQFDDKLCIDKNYTNLNPSISTKPTAWNKVVYHLCEESQDNFSIIIEDDVFIPNIDSLKKLFSYSEHYLVTAFNKKKKEYISNDSWVWKDVVDKINEPYFYSMVCIMGISKNLIKIIKDYVIKNKTCFYLEVFFNTLANQNSLKVITPIELSTIIYNIDWTDDEIIEKPNNFFHPLKDFSKHKILRNLV